MLIRVLPYWHTKHSQQLPMVPTAKTKSMWRLSSKFCVEIVNPISSALKILLESSTLKRIPTYTVPIRAQD